MKNFASLALVGPWALQVFLDAVCVKTKGKCSKKPVKIMTQRLSWALARQSETERILTTLLISWHEGQQ